MKKINKISIYFLNLFLLLIFFVPIVTNAASTDHFVFKVTITDGGDTTFTIPTTGTGYNYDVDWDNDQTFEDTGNTGDATHDFTTTGTYTVRVTGTFPRIYFNNTGDKLKITEISQWGTISWTSMEKAFYGASNLDVTATDTPDLSGVTDISYMFYGATSLQDRAGTFQSAVNYSASASGPRGINVGDLNGDEYTDVVLNSSSGFSIFFNDGDGTFASEVFYNVSTAGLQFDIKDIDNDGDQDIIMVDLAGKVVVYKNNGSGTFNLYSTSGNVSALIALTLGDIDNDGDLDVIGSDYVGGDTITMTNNGEGKFSNEVIYETEFGVFTTAVADFNDDGYNDIASAAGENTKLYTFINNGDGTFANPILYGPTNFSGYYARGISFVDMDQDGDIDLVGSIKNTDNTVVSVMMNNGSGVFTTLATYGVSQPFYNAKIETGDLNGDGYPDVVVAQDHNWNRVSVFLNDGDGTLGAVTDYSVASNNEAIKLADFNKDGLLDIVSGNKSANSISILMNKSVGFNDWDVSNVTNTSYMFSNATFNQGLSSWNVSSATNMTSMFQDNTIFNQDLSDWDVTSVTNMTDMFDGATLSTDNYDNLLEGWKLLNLQSSVVFSGGNSTYCYGESERQYIVNTYGWTITDGGYDCTDATTRITISQGGTSNNFTTSKKPPVPSFNIQQVDNNTVNILGVYSPNNIVVNKLAIEYTNNKTNKKKEYEISSSLAYKSTFAFKNLLDLEEDTSYTFKIYAENSQGKTYGNTVELTLGNPDNNTNTTDDDNNTDDTTVDEETEELIKQLQAQIESLMQQILEILMKKVAGYTGN